MPGRGPRTAVGGLVVVQAHVVGRDVRVGLRAARQHHRAAHGLRRAAARVRQQVHGALEARKVDLARALPRERPRAAGSLATLVRLAKAYEPRAPGSTVAWPRHGRQLRAAAHACLPLRLSAAWCQAAVTAPSGRRTRVRGPMGGGRARRASRRARALPLTLEKTRSTCAGVRPAPSSPQSRASLAKPRPSISAPAGRPAPAPPCPNCVNARKAACSSPSCTGSQAAWRGAAPAARQRLTKQAPHGLAGVRAAALGGGLRMRRLASGSGALSEVAPCLAACRDPQLMQKPGPSCSMRELALCRSSPSAQLQGWGAPAPTTAHTRHTRHSPHQAPGWSQALTVWPAAAGGARRGAHGSCCRAPRPARAQRPACP